MTRTTWTIVKQLARRAEMADMHFAGLDAVLDTHDTRHHYARTALNRAANLSLVQDLPQPQTQLTCVIVAT